MSNSCEINQSFEIVGFYPAKTKDKKFVGTLHAYLPEADIDFRGINVFRKGKGFFYKLPEKFQLDPETNTIEKYPIMSFNNPEKYKRMIDFLQKKAPPIIQEEMKKHEKNPRVVDSGSNSQRSKSGWRTLDCKIKKTSKPKVVGGAMEQSTSNP